MVIQKGTPQERYSGLQGRELRQREEQNRRIQQEQAQAREQYETQLKEFEAVKLEQQKNLDFAKQLRQKQEDLERTLEGQAGLPENVRGNPLLIQRYVESTRETQRQLGRLIDALESGQMSANIDVNQALGLAQAGAREESYYREQTRQSERTREKAEERLEKAKQDFERLQTKEAFQKVQFYGKQLGEQYQLRTETAGTLITRELTPQEIIAREEQRLHQTLTPRARQEVLNKYYSQVAQTPYVPEYATKILAREAPEKRMTEIIGYETNIRSIPTKIEVPKIEYKPQQDIYFKGKETFFPQISRLVRYETEKAFGTLATVITKPLPQELRVPSFALEEARSLKKDLSQLKTLRRLSLDRKPHQIEPKEIDTILVTFGEPSRKNSLYKANGKPITTKILKTEDQNLPIGITTTPEFINIPIREPARKFVSGALDIGTTIFIKPKFLAEVGLGVLSGGSKLIYKTEKPTTEEFIDIGFVGLYGAGKVGKKLFETAKYIPAEETGIKFVESTTIPRSYQYLKSLEGQRVPVTHVTFAPEISRAKQGKEIILKQFPEYAKGYRKEAGALGFYVSAPEKTIQGLKPTAYLAYADIGAKSAGAEKIAFTLLPVKRKIILATPFVTPTSEELARRLTQKELTEYQLRQAGKTFVPAENIPLTKEPIFKTTEGQLIATTQNIEKGMLGSKLILKSPEYYTYYKQQKKAPFKFLEPLYKTRLAKGLGLSEKKYKFYLQAGEIVPAVEGASREQAKILNISEYSKSYGKRKPIAISTLAVSLSPRAGSLALSLKPSSAKSSLRNILSKISYSQPQKSEVSFPSAPSKPSKTFSLISTSITPSTPSVPSKPSMPSIPSIPSRPNVPSKPSMPSIPSIPSRPNVPSKPSIPLPPRQPIISSVKFQKPQASLITALKKVQAYNVLVKRFGKEFLIAKGLPLGRARQAGAKYLKQTLGATARLQQAGFTGLEDVSFDLGKEFRGYKIVGGRRVETPLQFIQRAPYRLSSKSEVSEIQKARKNSIFFNKRRKGRARL